MAPRIDGAGDREGAGVRMAQRDRREVAPDRKRGRSGGLGLGPPRGRVDGRALGEPRDLAALEEADARERVLAAEQRIEAARDLAAAIPSRDPGGGRVLADLPLELADEPIGAEGRCGDPA